MDSIGLGTLCSPLHKVKLSLHKLLVDIYSFYKYIQ